MLQTSYTSGIVGVFWLFLWAFLVFDSPAEHPCIPVKETCYVKQSLKFQVSNKVVGIQFSVIQMLLFIAHHMT